jgi:hypothetical protein
MKIYELFKGKNSNSKLLVCSIFPIFANTIILVNLLIYYLFIMIKHIVLWTFHENADGRNKDDNISIAIEQINDLKNKIPSVINLETGTTITHGNDSFDLALYAEFENIAGLKIYQEHPEHQRVIGFLKKVRDKRVFVDYEV